MKELKGTKTEANLQTAFAGESQAATKYGYYASAAKKDGYNQISAIFEETAGNEKEHAKLWFKLLHGARCLERKTTLQMPQPAKTMSGRTCMIHLQRKRAKKALRISRSCSKALAGLKKSMKSAIASCLQISRKAKCLHGMASAFGSA